MDRTTNIEQRTTSHVLLAALVWLAFTSALLHAQTLPSQDAMRLRLSMSLASLDRGIAAGPQAVHQTSANCVVLDPELQGRYFGSCKDGLAEGYGQAIGAAEYKGGFRAGRKHGKGTKTWPASGDRYEGEFRDERREGVGTYTWGPRSVWAGEKYTGGYLNDWRHGSGIYEWPGGDRYSGTWKNDVITGQPTPQMFVRARAQGEMAAAVGTPGTVLTVEDDKLVVRIDDAGKFQHTIAGFPIAKTGIVRDAPQFWTPCLDPVVGKR